MSMDSEVSQPKMGASEGVGTLLQRDYWAAFELKNWAPEALIKLVKSDFPSFAPASLVEFTRVGGENRPLQVGDEMEINILLAGRCKVKVVHEDHHSLSLQTLEGHPEAGRITFGATALADGLMEFRIRSRSRASSLTNLMGYLFGGKLMQTETWTTFVKNVVKECGGTLVGDVHVLDSEVQDEVRDSPDVPVPTFPTEESA